MAKLKALEPEMVKRINVALKAVKKIGKKAREGFFCQKVRSFLKEEQEMVTEYDLLIDTFLKEKLARRFKDGWISEESGALESQTGFSWILDPIDGTNNFAGKVPFFCIALALYRHSVPVAGMVYDPVHRIFYLSCGKESYEIYGKKARKITLQPLQPEEALIGFGLSKPYLSHCKEVKDAWIALEAKTRASRRYGSAALEIVYVGLGRLGLYWIMGHKIWDVAAALVFARNAGMRVREFPEKNTLVVYHPDLDETARDFLYQLEHHD